MDAVLSNNLSRGLAAVAGTFGQYAQAAHQDRMEAAKEQFQTMLESKKEDSRDAQTTALETQRAADRAAESALSRQQHQDDKAQQASQFNQSQSRLQSQFNETKAQTAQRIKIEQERADKTGTGSGASKGLTPQQRITNAQSVWRTNSGLYAAAIKAAGIMPSPEAQKAVADAKSAMDASKANVDALTSSGGVPPTSGGESASSKIMPNMVYGTKNGYVRTDGDGNIIKGSDGKPKIITNRTDVQKALDETKAARAATQPGQPSASAPTSPAQGQPAQQGQPADDDDEGDTLGGVNVGQADQPPTAGSYAQQPQQTPPDQTQPLLGQANVPQLAT